MKRQNTSLDNIIIAWAIPVRLEPLAARLQAYVETKAAITTFRLAVRHSAIGVCQITPEEIISLIASFIRDEASTRKMRNWTAVTRCLNNTCDKLSHLSRHDTSRIIRNGGTKNQLRWEAGKKHQNCVIQNCEMLSKLGGSSIFIFTRDFGIRPYFTIHKFYDNDGYRGPDFIKHVQAKAFLTLPVFSGPIASNPGYEVASLSFCKTIDLSALRELSEGQIRQFTLATNILRLRPHDPETTQSSDQNEGRGADWPQLMMLGSGEVEAYHRDD